MATLSWSAMYLYSLLTCAPCGANLKATPCCQSALLATNWSGPFSSCVRPEPCQHQARHAGDTTYTWRIS